MSEKGFCEFLNEQIIDERNAQKAYKKLLDLFGDETESLVSKYPEAEARGEIAYGAESALITIRHSEAGHEEILERLRRTLCEAKEE